MIPSPRRLRDEARARLADRQRGLDALLAETNAIGAVADDEHDPDGSPVSLQRVLASALVDRARMDVAAAEDACRRVADGTYGVCEGCGRAIPPERLAALPAARTCVRCELDASRRRLTSG